MSLVLYVDNDMFGKSSQNTDMLKLHLFSAKVKALKEFMVENLECIIKTYTDEFYHTCPVHTEQSKTAYLWF